MNFISTLNLILHLLVCLYVLIHIGSVPTKHWHDGTWWAIGGLVVEAAKKIWQMFWGWTGDLETAMLGTNLFSLAATLCFFIMFLKLHPAFVRVIDLRKRNP